MDNIYNYTDHRQYLRDWFDSVRSKEQKFSYQAFSERVGFRNRGFIYNILHGDKALSAANLRKLSTAVTHKPQEADYFRSLVQFSQTDEPKLRRRLWDKLLEIKWARTETKKILKLRRDQFEFYENWYHAAVFSLLGIREYRDDWIQLARQVYPPIKPLQAEKSVELLERLGLAARDAQGVWRLTKKHLVATPEILSLAVQKFHIDFAQLVRNALYNLALEDRNVSGITLGISRPTYELICDEIQAFRRRLAQLADQDEKPDRVYHLNLQFIPCSKPMKKKHT